MLPRPQRTVLAASAVLAALAAGGCSVPGGGGSGPDDGAARGSVAGRDAAERQAPSRLRAATRRAPAPPRTAAEAARDLTLATRAIDDPGTPRDLLAAAGRVEQVAYRALGDHPDWDAVVLRQLPESVHARAAANVASRRAFGSMLTSPGDTLPAWRVVAPAPAPRLLAAYREGERRFGVDWEVLAAVNLVETGMGRIRGTSVAGALGPMQFLPATWAQYGRGEVTDPHDAILGAARYLAAMGFDGPGGQAAALYRYNNSTAYVQGVSLLAGVMRRDARAFLGYYHWEVYYRTSRGDVLLPVGYHRDREVPVDRYLARRPAAG